MFAPGLFVSTHEYALQNILLVRQSKLAAASPGLQVCRSPIFDGEPSGRVRDGNGTVIDYGNEIGCITVFWHDSGDRTTWTRASNGEFDVITAIQER